MLFSRRLSFLLPYFALGLLSASSLSSTLQAALMISVVEESAAAGYVDPVLMQGAFGEDAVAFSDRPHQWNGFSTNNATAHPTIGGLGLTGADYVRFANDARAVASSAVAYSVTFSEEARVFLFLDTRHTAPGWLADMGFERIPSTRGDDHHLMGYDEGQSSADLGVGPGASINTRAWIYSAKLAAGTHAFHGLGFAGNNNYGLVATGGKTVVGAVTRLHGSSAHPVLQRQGMGHLAKAFVDRPHRVVLQSTVLNALPELNGADLLQLSNDVRDTPHTTPLYEVSLVEDAYAYLLLDDRYTQSAAESLNWIAAMGFTDTLLNAGLDENLDGFADQTLSIYRSYLSRGVYQFNGMQFGNSNHYILAFHSVPEPNKATLAFASCLILTTLRSRNRSRS